MKQLLILLMLLALPAASLLAQEGPRVPCVNCESIIYAPLSGAWSLVHSETPGVMWELEVEPQRFTGGMLE